jgi:hypothetical protein
MWKRRTSFGAGSEVDGVLRAQRSEASDEFVERLSGRLHELHSRTQRAWSRAAFAGAISIFILGTFASFGGLSYAASGASGTYHAVKQVAAKHAFIVTVHKSSAASQYAPTPKPHKQTHPNSGVAGTQAGVAGIAGVRSGGTLPFTGISLLTTLIISIGLIVLGLALRRRERRD